MPQPAGGEVMVRFIISTGVLLGVVILIGIKLAHGGDYGDRYACFGAGRYDAMRDGRECPEPLKVAWYCKPLVGMERSCSSVRAMVKTLGAARAEKLARKCGATDNDIEQAKACLR